MSVSRRRLTLFLVTVRVRAPSTYLEPEQASPEELEQRRPSVSALRLCQQLPTGGHAGGHRAAVQREQRPDHRVVPQQRQADRGEGKMVLQLDEPYSFGGFCF